MSEFATFLSVGASGACHSKRITIEDENVSHGVAQIDEDMSNSSWLKSFITSLTGWLAVQEESGFDALEFSSPDLDSSLIFSTSPSLSQDLSSSLQLQNSIMLDEESIWSQWEWVVSKAEEIVTKKCKENSEDLRKELQDLRERANKLKSKPNFLEQSKYSLTDYFLRSEPSDIQILQETVLDSSKRSKIITDIITTFSPTWLEFLQNLFFKDDVKKSDLFNELYKESSYNKGIEGGLKEIGWNASHGSGKTGLNYIILGEILWSFWNTLCSALCCFLERELTREEQSLIEEKIRISEIPLIELWMGTVKNSMLGSQKEGICVKRWKEEELKYKEKIKKIKSEGVSAKYEFLNYNTRGSLLAAERKPIGELKKLLEGRLTFRIMDD